MKKLSDTLWNWAHLQGSHNKYMSGDYSISPEDFAKEFGVPNAFIVSFNGNIVPPFDNMAQRFSGLREIKWAVLGDVSTPMPEDELGHTKDILAIQDIAKNLTGGILDDFFIPERMEKYTPEVLKKIRKALNDQGKDFWCVLYSNQLEMDLTDFLECFDGVSLWVWESETIPQLPQFFAKLKEIAPGKRYMLGVYLWEYNVKKAIDPKLFEQHISQCFKLTMEKEIEGTVFCSNTVCGGDFESVKILKDYVAKYGDQIIE